MEAMEAMKTIVSRVSRLFSVPYHGFKRYISGNVLIVLEVGFLCLLMCFPDLWKTWVASFTCVILILLLPLNNTPLWDNIPVVALYLWRKVRKPRLKAHLVPQNMRVEDAILHDGRFFFSPWNLP